MTAASWRGLFWAAAAFNLFVGLGLMLAPVAVYGIAGTTPPSALEPRLIGLLVAGLGIGYAIAATDPVRNRGIVQAGAIGKFGAVVLIWAHYLTGQAPAAFAIAVLGDLVFALAFLAFLLRHRS